MPTIDLSGCPCCNPDTTPDCSTYPDTLYGRWTDKTGDATNLVTDHVYNRVGPVCDVASCGWDGELGSFAMGACSGGFQGYLHVFCYGPGNVAGPGSTELTPGFYYKCVASSGAINGSVDLEPFTSTTLSPLSLVLEADITPGATYNCTGTATLEIRDVPF